MRTYACDWCRRSRNPGERWLLGFAAERIGSAGVQREISMAGRWSDSAAEHPLAVHFCSAGHRNAYVEALFNSIPTSRRAARKSQPQAAENGSRSGISLGFGCGGIQTGEKIAQTAKPKAKRATKVKPKKARVERASFNFADGIRSHGMGVHLDGHTPQDSEIGS